MSTINILNKTGLLTNEDRKEPLEHGCNHFTFKTCLDLSKPIQVIPYGTSTKFTHQQYSQDLASFMCWWANFVMCDLNGFSGFSHVKFEFVNFELV